MKPFYFGPNDPENGVVGAFVSGLIWGEPNGFDKYCSMAVLDQDRLVAGSVFHNWHPDEGVVEISSASTDGRWLSPPVIKAMFGLPFDRLGCRLVVLRVSERHHKMRGIARRFGFQETVIPRLRGEDEAECVYTLSASEWAGHRMNR